MFDLTFQTIDLESGRLVFLREDLLPLACGGNKVRIAQKIVEDALKKNASVIVGYGNSRSNLCRVLSILCRMAGVRCVIISPRDENGVRVETINSRIVAQSGAEIVVCDKSAGVRTTIRNILTRLRENGERPYYINGDETGHGNEVVLASAYEEVGRRLVELKFDSIVLAVGTGSTVAGLYKGLRRGGAFTKLMGISIARTASQCYGALKDFEIENPTGLVIDDSFVLGGYGKSSLELDTFVDRFAFRYGVFLDTTYAGKALWGLDALRRSGGMQGEKILFVNTGSLPLALDRLR